MTALPTGLILDTIIARLSAAELVQLQAAWEDIQAHTDIGGRNADYARRSRFMGAALGIIAQRPPT